MKQATPFPTLPSRSSLPHKERTADCAHCLLLRSLQAAGMTSSSIQAVCDRLALQELPRRRTLFHEDSEPVYFYALRRGRVKLVKADPGGRRHVTTVLESGDLFGFEAVYNQNYGSTAETMTDCEICAGSGAELRDLMLEFPSMALDFGSYLHAQLSRTRERQAFLGALSASAKLAGFLVQELQHDDATEADGIVARNLTLQDLGGILGLSPETVCRIRGQFNARGIIETLTSGIRVKDRGTLKRLAGQ